MDEREEFEKWVRSQGYIDLGRLEHSGAYASEYVDLAWDAWRAALASKGHHS